MHGHKGPGVQQRQATTATILRDEKLLDHWVDRELITAVAEAAAARGADLLARRLRKVLSPRSSANWTNTGSEN
jgi:hypothetical protein